MIPTFPRATNNKILGLLIPICTFNLNGLVEITQKLAHFTRIEFEICFKFSPVFGPDIYPSSFEQKTHHFSPVFSGKILSFYRFARSEIAAVAHRIEGMNPRNGMKVKVETPERWRGMGIAPKKENKKVRSCY